MSRGYLVQQQEERDVWIPLLEAAEQVANPYFENEEQFRETVQKSFDELRKTIAKARKLADDR